MAKSGRRYKAPHRPRAITNQASTKKLNHLSPNDFLVQPFTLPDFGGRRFGETAARLLLTWQSLGSWRHVRLADFIDRIDAEIRQGTIHQNSLASGNDVEVRSQAHGRHLLVTAPLILANRGILVVNDPSLPPGHQFYGATDSFVDKLASYRKPGVA